MSNEHPHRWHIFFSMDLRKLMGRYRKRYSIQFYRQVLITNSSFWLVDIPLRKSDISSKGKNRSTNCFLLDKEERAFSLVVMALIMKNSDDLQDFGPYFLGQNPWCCFLCTCQKQSICLETLTSVQCICPVIQLYSSYKSATVPQFEQFIV